MGTAVIPIFTRHPWVMAQQAITVQTASNGRLALGLGLSHKIIMENSFGIKYQKLAQHAIEYLSVLNQLNESFSVDFTGELYRAQGVINLPKVSKFPLFFAALGPKMLEAAGEYADGTITWMAGKNVLRKNIIPIINKSAKLNNRPKPKIIVGIPIAVTDDTQKGRQTADEIFAFYKKMPSYKRLLDLENASSISEVAIIGNKDSVKSQLQQYYSAGATEVLAMVFPVGDDKNGSVDQTWTALSEFVNQIG